MGGIPELEQVGQASEPPATPRPETPNLAALIECMAGGDQDALAALYDATSSTVYGLALTILHDQSGAEEVTIEAYMQAYRQAASYDPARGSPWAWLVTLARSRAIDRVRAESTRRQREQPLETVAGLASTALDPEEVPPRRPGSPGEGRASQADARAAAGHRDRVLLRVHP